MSSLQHCKIFVYLNNDDICLVFCQFCGWSSRSVKLRPIFKKSQTSMIVILDGDSEKDAHLKTILLLDLFKAFDQLRSNEFFFLPGSATFFELPSDINTMQTSVALSFTVFSRFTDNRTMCPRSSDQFYKVTYYIKWVNTSWTYSTRCWGKNYGKHRN